MELETSQEENQNRVNMQATSLNKTNCGSWHSHETVRIKAQKQPKNEEV